MLVLSRKVGERILLSQLEIAVQVLAVHGKTVRLGISAPADVDIAREEVWRQVPQQSRRQTAEG